MASFLRYTAVSAIFSAAAGFAIGAMPSQTIGIGFGEPMPQQPTEAPSLELLKRKLEKKALTNTCTEWTILGGYGQPECSNSETCLFTSADGYGFEGCGETSISYNWITECWGWPQTQFGTAPVSQTFCNEFAPYCGFFAFVFTPGWTYSNFGCSTSPYSFFAELLPSTSGGTTSEVVLNGGGGSSITESGAAATVTETQPPAISTSTNLVANPTQSASGLNIGSHSMSKAPTGAIVGGVIGGIALIALLAFLLWFFLRKRKQDQAAAQILQQQADVATAAAFNSHNQVQEIAGTPKPHGAYGPPPVASIYPEKQTADSNTQEFHGPPGQQNQSAYTDNAYAPGQQNQNAYKETSYGGSQSPPPTYSLPPKQQQQSPISLVPSPPSNYNELEQRDDRPNSMRMPSPAPALPGNYNELEQGGVNRPMRNQIPPPPSNYNELEQIDDRPMSTRVPSELAEGEDRRISTVSPLMRQELFADNRGRYARVPRGPPPQELSASTGGINRRPVGGSGIGRQSAGFDMSGAPLGEEYTSELE